jgi:hypothetical protein
MIISLSGKKQSGKDTVGNIIQYLIWKDKLDREEFYISKNYDYKYFTEVASFQDILSGWQIKKFADKLKEIVSLLLGCTKEQLEDETFKNSELGDEWDKWEVEILESRDKLYKDTEQEARDWIKFLKDEYGKNCYPPKKIKMTPRLLLQLVGTECGREIIHPNIWVNSLMSEYKPNWIESTKQYWKDKMSELPNWIITDTRFPNEVNAVKLKDGVSIRINRSMTSDEWLKCYPDLNIMDYDGWDRSNYQYSFYEEKIDLNTFKKRVNSSTVLLESSKDIFDEHESETALDDYSDWDYVINNDGDLDELIEKIKLILIDLKLIKS